MAILHLTLLGGLAVRSAVGGPVTLPRRKAQALLAYLALRPGQAHPRDKLAALLWPEARAERARHSLRQVLVALRQTLARALVEGGDSIALAPAAVEVDVAAFERLAADGTPEALERAAALYQGDLLEGLRVEEPPLEEWLLSERERLRELAIEALAKLLAHQVARGPTDGAVRTAARLLALDPLQEPVHRTLMRLYARDGRWGMAIRQYQSCLRALQRELGTEPEPETRQLYQDLLRRQVPGPPIAAVPAAPTTVVPVAARLGIRAETLATDTPLVGRQAELRRLREAWQATAERRGPLAVVLGEAGIGKTRLVAALAAEAERQGGTLLLGRAHETEQALPFAPWVDAIRTGGLTRDDGLRQTLGPVWCAELARLFPELGQPASSLSSGPENAVRLFEAVVQLFDHLVARGRVLLLLEDLQWADEMSLRLLAFLARRLGSWPLLAVATAREEDLTEAAVLRRLLQELGREGHGVMLTLAPLSREDTAALARALARAGSRDADAARLAERAWEASGGNPFVAVEVVRALQQGLAPREGGELPLPQRVRELITSRLDRLSATGREVAATAAVIGREFDFALLRRASTLDDRETAEGVEELVRRRLLEGRGDRLDFTHERIRAVAYGELLPPRRKLLHGQIADAIEAFAGGEDLEPHYGALALHYREGEVWPKAVEFLSRFAEQAARRYAHAEAAAALGQALPHVTELPAAPSRERLRLELALRRVNSLYFLGRFGDSLDALVEHRDHVERLDDPRLSGPYQFWLGHTYSYLGDQERAVQSAHRAIAEAERCDDRVTLGRAHYLLAREGHWSGQFEQGVEHGRQAVAWLAPTPERWWLGQSEWITGINYALMGQFAPALETEERARAIGEAIGNPRLQTYAAFSSGLVHALMGEWEAAVEHCRRAIERSPDPINGALADGLLGHAYVEGRQPAEAIPRLEQAIDRLDELRFRQIGGWFRTFLGEAYLVAGQVDKARELAARGLAITTEVRFRYAVGWSQRVLGRIARAEGAGSAGEASLQEALGTFAAIGAEYEVARTHLDLAALARDRGDRAAAATHLREAHGRFLALGVPRYARRAVELAGEFGVRLAEPPAG